MTHEMERQPSEEARPLFSPLAHAFARRGSIERDLRKNDFLTIVGDQAEVPKDSTVETGINSILSLIQAQRLVDGIEILTPEQKEEIFDAFGADSMVKLEAAESGIPQEDAQVKIEIAKFTRQKTGEAGKKITNRGPQYISNARQFAQEIGVTAEQVFLDDKLYEELVRRTLKPAELISEILEAIGDLGNQEVIEEGVRAIIVKNLPGFDELPDFIKEMVLAEVFNAPEYRDTIDKQLKVLKDGVKGVLIKQVGRFWGQDIAAQSIASVYLHEGNGEGSRRSGILEQILNERGLSISDLKSVGSALTISEMEDISREVNRRLGLEN